MMNIKNLIKSDWETPIKKTAYNLAKVIIFFYVSGEITKNWVLNLNDDVTKLYGVLSDKIRSLL
jgi:hypothetical protein